jgi:hypothetical protein
MIFKQFKGLFSAACFKADLNGEQRTSQQQLDPFAKEGVIVNDGNADVGIRHDEAAGQPGIFSFGSSVGPICSVFSILKRIATMEVSKELEKMSQAFNGLACHGANPAAR